MCAFDDGGADGSEYRRGFSPRLVDDRTQVLNPTTEIWTKRDTNTGRFMQGKEDGTPFKGVAKEIDLRRNQE
jgi:hypothetical protein